MYNLTNRFHNYLMEFGNQLPFSFAIYYNPRPWSLIETGAIFDARIYKGRNNWTGKTIVVLSNPSSLRGISIVNNYEDVATLAWREIKKKPLFWFLNPSDVIWVHHFPITALPDDRYEPDRINVVEMDYQKEKFTHPKWIGRNLLRRDILNNIDGGFRQYLLEELNS